MRYKRSSALFAQAKQVIPGGVNSPVRAFKSVGGIPRFLSKASGAYLFDVDGNKYVDTICSWGPAIVGHSHPKVIDAITTAASKGLSFGAPTPNETNLAELICNFLPSIEMVRLTSSGTEATMSAIRLARGATNRTKIIKFEGCYHGHVDSLLVKAGSGLLTAGKPTSSGIPESFSQETLVLPFNDEESLEDKKATNLPISSALTIESLGTDAFSNIFLFKIELPVLSGIETIPALNILILASDFLPRLTAIFLTYDSTAPLVMLYA